MKITPKQFTYDDLNTHAGRGEDGYPYWFECAMISACEPLFPEDWDNHNVQDALIKAKVIRGGQPDSESCALVINFTSKKAGEAFIDRLNAYLVKKAELLEAAQAF